MLNETEAIEWALDNAPDNSLVTIFADNITRAIALIMSRNPIPDEPEVTFPAELNQDNSPIWDPISASSNGKYS